MRRFVLLSSLALLVSARPEAGYSYNRPSGNNFGPGGPGFGPSLGPQPGFNQGPGFGQGGGGFHQNSISGGGGGYQNGGSFQSSVSSGSFGSGGSLLGPGSGPLVGPTGGSIGGGSFHSSSGFQQNGGFQSGGGGFHSGGSFQTNGGGGFQQNGFQTGGGFNPGFTHPGALIQKHIYVHVPPPDPEEHRAPTIHGQFGPPQKHYKIIFIKAPSGPSYDSASLPLPPQNEEKTLVYVLVKKPDDASDIYLNNAPTTPPSKPEVYFIKYKTQKDRQNIATGGGGSGVIENQGGLVSGGGGSLIGGGTTASGSGSLNGGSLNGGSLNGGGNGGPIGNVGPAPQYGPPGGPRPF